MGEAKWLNAVQTENTVSFGSYKAKIGDRASLLQLSTTCRKRVTSKDAASTEERMVTALESLSQIAEELRGDSEALLMLLRNLEARHRDVQDGAFRQSLPENRQKLFSLLQGMEKNGGWPYIPRLQLRTFIDLLGQDSIDAAA